MLNKKTRNVSHCYQNLSNENIFLSHELFLTGEKGYTLAHCERYEKQCIIKLSPCKYAINQEAFRETVHELLVCKTKRKRDPRI